MTNRYDPNQNIPGFIPAAPSLMQGQPLRVPLSLEGCSQEDLRREMMRRTGQYGPLPMRRVRGAIGGQNVALGPPQWQTLLRVDPFHADATGAENGSYKTLVTLAQAKELYDTDGGGAHNPLGMIVKLYFGAGGTMGNTLIFDVPLNGMVHVPFVGETVIAEVATEKKIYAAADIATWVPDNPTLGTVDLTASGLVNAPVVSGALVEAQSLPTNHVNMPTRQVCVTLGTGGSGTIVVPIPRGSQAVQVVGPADIQPYQRILDAGDVKVAFDANTIVPLFSTAANIDLVSPSDGGNSLVFFYLGI